MESASQAPVTFNDVMCQMQDMLSPATPGHFSLRDLRKTRQLAGTLFNILFNISKFVAYETRDPFLIRQEKTDDPDATDWDRCGDRVSDLNVLLGVSPFTLFLGVRNSAGTEPAATPTVQHVGVHTMHARSR